MRSDSVLLTGMNSGTVNKVERSKEKEKLRQEAKLRTKAKIHPSIEPVLEEIDKEIKATILAQLDLIDTSTGDFTSNALALKLYKESCQKLKNRLSNIMRTEEKK